MKLTERQEQIVKAAIELISGKGVRFLTMKRVAEQIGVTEPAVYRHFPNKQAIMLAILEYFDARRRQILDDYEGKTAFIQIEHFVLGLFALFTEDSPLARVMFAEDFFQGEQELSAKMLSIMHTHRNRMVGLIREAQMNRDIRGDLPPLQIFRIIIGPIRLLVTQWCLSGRGFDLRTEGDEVWSALKRVLNS